MRTRFQPERRQHDGNIVAAERGADSLSQMVTERKGKAGTLSAKRAQDWISLAKRHQGGS